MKTRIAILVSAIFMVALICCAEDGPEEEVRRIRLALTHLRSECDIPGQSNQPTWGSYIFSTERARIRCAEHLKPIASEALPVVRSEWEQATGEYKQMLAIMLATLGDKTMIEDVTDILLMSKHPATRVCAAFALRAIKDKSTIAALRKALRDPCIRSDGGCVPGRLIYPVRMIASDALVEMGIPFDEVRKLRGDFPTRSAEP